MKEKKLKGTVMQLEGKKRGRPSLVDEAITKTYCSFKRGRGCCQYPYCDSCWCLDSSA